jgi:hypothetical protein
LDSAGDKQSPIEGSRPKQKQADNASLHPRLTLILQTDAGLFIEFENAESIRPRDDLVRSGDNEVIQDPESVIEASYLVLNRNERLLDLLSDGESRKDGHNHF